MSEVSETPVVAEEEAPVGGEDTEATETTETTEESTSDTSSDVSISTDDVRLLEAVLFSSPEPMSERALKSRLPEDADLPQLLKNLKEHYADRGVRLVRIGSAWAFRTAPDLANKMNVETDVSRKLSRAAIETLAIIAYHQPITRGEIEEVRGVSLSRGTLDVLFDAGWIRPRGHRQTPGRPAMWGTTDAFLDHFGLEDVKDLPGVKELKAAGLLDARPAVEAYGVHGAMAGREEVAAELDAREAAEKAAAEQRAEEEGEENEDLGLVLDEDPVEETGGTGLPDGADDGEVPEPLLETDEDDVDDDGDDADDEYDEYAEYAENDGENDGETDDADDPGKK